MEVSFSMQALAGMRTFPLGPSVAVAVSGNNAMNRS
jgi:hypothetical protein